MGLYCSSRFGVFCLVGWTLLFLLSRGENVNYNLGFLNGGKFYAGAFFCALEDVNRDPNLLANLTLGYFFAHTNPDSLAYIRAMTNQYGNGTVGFIGPDGPCACEATVAAAWNLPMIAYKCHDSVLSLDEESGVSRRTFARTQPSTAKVSKSIMALLQKYHWRKITLIVGNSVKWNETAESLLEHIKRTDILVVEKIFFEMPYAPSDIMFNTVERTYKRTRIYVFLGDYHAFIDFVRPLYDLTQENIKFYVVIAIEDKEFYSDDSAQYLLKQPFEERNRMYDEHIWKAFQPVMLLVPRPPINSQWDEFAERVKIRNVQYPINGPLPYYCENTMEFVLNKTSECNSTSYKVPIYAAYLYDSVMVYAKALNQTLAEGIDIHDGFRIIQKIRSITYKSVLGYEIFVDEQGDSEGNYTLLALKKQGLTLPRLQRVGNFTMVIGDYSNGIPDLHVDGIEWTLGEPPPDEPRCGFSNEKCTQQLDWEPVTIGGITSAVVIVALVFIVRHYLYEKKLERLLWKVDYKDIVLVDSVEEIIAPTRRKQRRSHPWKFLLSYENESERTTLLGDTRNQKEQSSREGEPSGKRITIGSYKGNIVTVKHILKKHVEINRSLKKQLQIRKELNHDNINRFIGACMEPPHIYILTQYCQRGSLEDILQNDDIHLDDMFVASLVSDLIKGMIFIHESEIVTHGNLKSSNCLVDSRWVLQIADFGFQQLKSDRSASLTDIQKHYKNIAWKAPELLRDMNRDPRGTQKGDVYSFALVLYDIIGRKGPWGITGYSYKENTNICLNHECIYNQGDYNLVLHSASTTDWDPLECDDIDNYAKTISDYIVLIAGRSIPNETVKLNHHNLHGSQRQSKDKYTDVRGLLKKIVDKVKSRTEHDVFRPELSFLSCEPFVKQCLMECWCEDPEQRPDFKFIRYRLKPLQAGLNSNILDNMIAMMEKYAHNLEGLVAERTEQLSEEKKMTENLLLRMLPRFVADQLKRGKPVAPETFDSVTCYFSDIVGFTALSADSTPFEIVCMLNDLYTYFDSIADNYDAYKVETIGDAYFVVSGLPIRNGDLHAGEIASMSLELLDAIKKFKIRHKPHETLKLRIGIHSGPCVAGVVGLRMPRYTLFGDTVNTASRMETTGVPLKIHCSAECRAILKKLGGYTLSERGYVKMKGKGELLTYFLEEEDSSTRIRRLSDVKSSLLNKTQSGSILGPKLVAGDTGCDKNSNCSGYWSAEVPPTPTIDQNLTPCDSQSNVGLEYLTVNQLSRTSLWSTSHSENSNHVSGDHFNDSSSPTVLGRCMEDMLWNNVLYEDCEDTVNVDSNYSLVTMSEDVETSPEYIHLLDMFTSNTQDCIKDGATMEMV